MGYTVKRSGSEQSGAVPAAGRDGRFSQNPRAQNGNNRLINQYFLIGNFGMNGQKKKFEKRKLYPEP